MPLSNAQQNTVDGFVEPGLTDYTSMGLQLFMENLPEQTQGRLLDVGPVCNQNINVFARRVKKLYLCDLFLRLARLREQKSPPEGLWRDLDYPSSFFDGILLWDLSDRISENEARELIRLCHDMAKPGGMVLAFALGEGMRSPSVRSFTLGRDYRVSLRPQSHLNLPVAATRQNRKMLALFNQFQPVKSFIYRSGFREFLFRRI